MLVQNQRQGAKPPAVTHQLSERIGDSTATQIQRNAEFFAE
jgi:hypothetical protein